MRLILPATRTFAYLCGGAAAALVIYVVVGNAIEPAGGWEPRPWVRVSIKAVFFTVVLVVVYSGWALMIRSSIGFIAASWMRLAAARSRDLTDTVTGKALSARKVGDVIIIAGWTIWTLGLAIVVPAAIRDGFFS